MKILFTSVGRRVELIQAFRKVADEQKIELTIIGADSAKAVLKILGGEKLSYEDKAARNGAIFSHFDQSVCVNEVIEK